MNLNNWDASPRWDLNYLFSGGRCRDLEFSPLESSGDAGEVAPTRPSTGTTSGSTTTMPTSTTTSTPTRPSTSTTTTTPTTTTPSTSTGSVFGSVFIPNISNISTTGKVKTPVYPLTQVRGGTFAGETKGLTPEQVKAQITLARQNATRLAQAEQQIRLQNIATSLPSGGGGGGGGPQEETAPEGTEQPKDDAKKPLSKKGIIMIGAIALVAYYLMSK